MTTTAATHACRIGKNWSDFHAVTASGLSYGAQSLDFVNMGVSSEVIGELYHVLGLLAKFEGPG